MITDFTTVIVYVKHEDKTTETLATYFYLTSLLHSFVCENKYNSHNIVLQVVHSCLAIVILTIILGNYISSTF